jgi:hypothetical protein
MAVPNDAWGHPLCKLPADAFHAAIVNDRVSVVDDRDEWCVDQR